jgi:hypothetical protein
VAAFDSRRRLTGLLCPNAYADASLKSRSGGGLLSDRPDNATKLTQKFGIVHLSRAYPARIGQPRFVGYWDSGEPPGLIENGPGWDEVEDAIRWGRERAPAVLLRLGADEDSIYSVGEADVPKRADGSGGYFPRWSNVIGRDA